MRLTFHFLWPRSTTFQQAHEPTNSNEPIPNWFQLTSAANDPPNHTPAHLTTHLLHYPTKTLGSLLVEREEYSTSWSRPLEMEMVGLEMVGRGGGDKEEMPNSLLMLDILT